MAEQKYAGPTTLSAVVDNIKNLFAKKSTSVTATLLASEWSGGIQSITVSGLGASQNGSVDIANTATLEQRSAAKYANMTISAQASNSLTIKANGVVPDVDIPITITLIG